MDSSPDSEQKQRNPSEASSEREMDAGCKSDYKLPLSLLENFINVKYRTQAKSGPRAYMKLKGRYGESAYIRLFMDWSRQSLPKPPAKYFTVKITPYYAVSSECGEHINTTESGSTEYVVSEMPEYENEDEKMAWLAMCHDVECDFLSFARQVEEPNIKVPFTVFAKHFFIELSDPGVIIFEDFKKTTDLPITADLSIECLKEVIDALADLHVTCFLTEDYSSHLHFPSSGRLNLTQFMRAVGIFKNAHPVLFGQMFDRIHEIIEDVLRTHYDNIDKQKKEHRPDVLVHGYLLSTNLRWKKPRDPEDPIDELAYIINWQNVRMGTVTEDLLYLLCSSTSPDIRRTAVNELVAHYIARFSQKYGRTIYSIDQILELINREFRFQALRALLPLAEYLAVSPDTGETTAAGAPSSTQMTVLLRAKCLFDDVASFT